MKETMRQSVLKWEKPRIVSLQMVAMGSCTSGSTAVQPTCTNGTGALATCGSGGTPSNRTCANGTSPQNPCSSGTRPGLI